jgi:GTPase SAR1 family protein
MLDGQEVLVNVLDTSGTPKQNPSTNNLPGQEELFTMRDAQIKNNQGFLLVYAVNDRSGFDEIKV